MITPPLTDEGLNSIALQLFMKLDREEMEDGVYEEE
jgi:hypothetical protein